MNSVKKKHDSITFEQRCSFRERTNEAKADDEARCATSRIHDTRTAFSDYPALTGYT